MRPLSQQFPDDPENTQQSLGKRFESVIGVLNAITKFNGEITVTTGRRVLSDGAEVAHIQRAWHGCSQRQWCQ